MAKRDLLKDLNYGDMLTTPGYSVEYAVGTTYSVDLKSLLIVPYSLGMFGDLSKQVKASPMFLLESIRRSSNVFTLFCQRGGIHVPNDAQSYYPLLEDCIIEMQNKKSPMSNFHPKLWVIKEKNKETGDEQMKVIIMSKNLVIDNNLDVVVSMTGKIGTEVSPKIDKLSPLHEYLYRLSDYAADDRRQRIRSIADDLYKVDTFEVDDNYFEKDGYEFVPFFYGECLNDKISFPRSFAGTSMMVISPFIDKQTLSVLNIRVTKGESVLVTRSNYVTKEVFDLFNKENSNVWIMNDQMVNNDIVPVDLHAKMYMVVSPKDENCIFLYLGSANATGAAFHQNSEILLRLKLKRGQYVFKKFKDEFLQLNNKGESLVYEQLHEPIETAEDNQYTELERYVRQLLTTEFKAEVSEVTDKLYNVTITAQAVYCPFKVSLSPLQAPSMKKGLTEHMTFENLSLDKLSEFYVLRADDGVKPVNEIIKIPTKGIPENRNDEIFRSIVDTQEKFYNYISFMLCDDPEEYVMELQQMKEMADISGTNRQQVRMPVRIYEQLLKIAANGPNRLRNLEDVMRIVGNETYTQEFRQLYELIKPLIFSLKKLQ